MNIKVSPIEVTVEVSPEIYIDVEFDLTDEELQCMVDKASDQKI